MAFWEKADVVADEAITRFASPLIHAAVLHARFELQPNFIHRLSWSGHPVL